MKIGYKVLLKDWTSTLHSTSHIMNRGNSIVYEPGNITSAPEGSPLFLFNSESAALSYKYELRDLGANFVVYKAIYEESDIIPYSLVNLWISSIDTKLFWNEKQYNLYRTTYNGFWDVPKNTVFAKSIFLLEEIKNDC